MILKVLTKKELNKIDTLPFMRDYDGYVAYRILREHELRKYLLNRILCGGETGKKILILGAYRKNQLVGLAVYTFLPWDTRILGIRTACVKFLVADGTCHDQVLIKCSLLSHLFEICRQEKTQFLNCRIKTDDVSGIHALEKQGFYLVETLVRYIFSRDKHSIPELRDLYRIREFKRNDLGRLRHLAKNSFRKNHFHRDLHIPQDKADAIYTKWLDRYCLDMPCEHVLVAENSEREAAGFLLYDFNQGLADTNGYRMIGHGLAAVSPRARGAFPALIKETIKRTVSFYDGAEFDTQIDNYVAMRIYQKFGFDYLCSHYTFHNWLSHECNTENKKL